jgi:hypothetical protein
MESIRERHSEAITGTRTANEDYLGVSHTVTNDYDYYWTPAGWLHRTHQYRHSARLQQWLAHDDYCTDQIRDCCTSSPAAPRWGIIDGSGRL